MRRLLLAVMLACSSCATFTEIVDGPEFTFDADDVQAGGLAIPFPRQWLVQSQKSSDKAVTIMAAQRGHFFFTGAIVTVIIRLGDFPKGFDKSRAKGLIPTDALIGPIDCGDRRIRFRWAKKEADGWRDGQVIIINPIGHEGLVVTFQSEWPRSGDETEIMRQTALMTDAVLHGR